MLPRMKLLIPPQTITDEHRSESVLFRVCLWPVFLRRVGLWPLVLVLLAGSATGAAKPRVSEASVRAHLEFLASDALNGRGSGTRDEQIDPLAWLANAKFKPSWKPGMKP